VIGVPDDEMGQAVRAVVQPAPGVAPTPELAAEILASLDGRLAKFKIPKQVDFVSDLPRTPTGKLVKGELVRRYAAGATDGLAG
jgi:long-chain acyl-CoA synthetase